MKKLYHLISFLFLTQLAFGQTTTVLYQKVTDAPPANMNLSSNARWVDYDNDNDMDLYLGGYNLTAQFPTFGHFMFKNNGVGISSFSNTVLPGFVVETDKVETDIAWSDVDNDGDKDLVTVHTTGGPADNQKYYLHRNNGNGSFTKSLIFTLSPLPFQRLGGHTMADFNNDGNIDLLIGFRSFSGATTDWRPPVLYQGNGNGAFTLVNVASNLTTTNFLVRGFSTGDMDGDGDIDIVSVDFSPLTRLFMNDGGFNFREVTLPTDPNGIFGYAGNLVDYDNDSDLDIYVSARNIPLIFRNDGSEQFTIINNLAISEDIGGTNGRDIWGDYDNDGDLDLYHHTLTNKALYINHNNGALFEKADLEPTNSLSEANHETRGAAFGDGNCDGFLDLYVANSFLNDNTDYYYENQGNSNSWLILKLNGTNSSGSAEGAKITATLTDIGSSPFLNQYREVNTEGGNPHDVHFGFGNYTGNVQLTIVWPSGATETVNTTLNKRLKITEGQGIVDDVCACNPSLPPSGPEISGSVGFDDQADCNCDNNNDKIPDVPVAQQWVEMKNNATRDAYFSQTDETGVFALNVPDGTYTVTPLLAPTTHVSNTCAGDPESLPKSSYEVTTPSLPGFPGGPGGPCVLGPCDFTVSLVADYGSTDYTTPCVDVQQLYCATIINSPGPAIVNPTITFNLAPDVVFNNIASNTCDASNLNITGTVLTGQTVTISPPNNGSIPTGGQCQVCINVTVTAVLNTVLTTNATVTVGQGNCTGESQASTPLVETVLCARDPNDKVLLFPQSCGAEGNIEMNKDLVYRVRFQNEGNAPAIHILINDQLDDDVDFSTVQVLASSHPVTKLIVLPGNQLVFKLDHINLPAKEVDEAGSQGYVMFSIKPKANRPEGTVIDNVASIYFDRNAAVVTNSTKNTLRSVPNPDAQFTESRSCKSLDMRYDFMYTGTTPDGAVYSWDFGPGASPQTSNLQNPIGVLFGTAGTKSVTLTVTRYGCSDVITKEIIVSSPLGCNGHSDWVTLCKGGNQICVPKKAAEKMLATDNFCVGACPTFKSLVAALGQLEIKLFPNPTSGKVNVVLPDELVAEKTSITILDIQGKVLEVLSSQGTNVVEADLSVYTSGIFIFKIESVNYSKIERIVKN